MDSAHPGVATKLSRPDSGVRFDMKSGDWFKLPHGTLSGSACMQNFVLAYIVSVTASQTHENHRREDGQSAQDVQSFMNPSNDSQWVETNLRRQKKDGSESRRCDTEADG